jgi:hypothetical protein
MEATSVFRDEVEAQGSHVHAVHVKVENKAAGARCKFRGINGWKEDGTGIQEAVRGLEKQVVIVVGNSLGDSSTHSGIDRSINALNHLPIQIIKEGVKLGPATQIAIMKVTLFFGISRRSIAIRNGTIPYVTIAEEGSLGLQQKVEKHLSNNRLMFLRAAGWNLGIISILAASSIWTSLIQPPRTWHPPGSGHEVAETLSSYILVCQSVSVF